MASLVGIVANQEDVASTLQLIKRADNLRFGSAWLTLAGTAPDSLALFAAAATQTEQIVFGTAIVPIWPRHPLALASQARAVNSLAPGRLRLGLGPGGAIMEQLYGIRYEHPLGHLREYVTILKTVFAEGQVDFDGHYYKAHARLSAPNQPLPKLNVPVMASALQHGSFELCGEVTDGALSWVSPLDYLYKVALPAMQAGAQKAGRPTPPLIAHIPVVVSENIAEVREAVRTRLGIYPRLPHYQKMFTAAGFAEVREGQWSDRMIEAAVVHGGPEEVQRQIREILANGIGEIMAHPIPAGADLPGSMSRTLETLAAITHSG